MALFDAGNVAFWTFESDLLDLIGAYHYSIISGSPAHFAAHLGNGLDFENTDSDALTLSDADIITAGDALSPGDTDWSFAWWLLREQSGSSDWWMQKGIFGSSIEFSIGLVASDFRFYVTHNGTTEKRAQETLNVTNGQWHLCRCYHDSVNNEIGCAMDDRSYVTAAHTTGVHQGTGPVTIGRRNAGTPDQYWDGGGDAGGWWTRVFTTGDDSDLWNTGSGQEPPAAGAAGAVALLKRAKPRTYIRMALREAVAARGVPAGMSRATRRAYLRKVLEDDRRRLAAQIRRKNSTAGGQSSCHSDGIPFNDYEVGTDGLWHPRRRLFLPHARGERYRLDQPIPLRRAG